jgi:hypothetical protein
VIDGAGNVDRKALGARVFNNPAEVRLSSCSPSPAPCHAVPPTVGVQQMKRLTALTWPAVGLDVRERLKGLEARGHTWAVLEAAMLLEAGWEGMVSWSRARAGALCPLAAQAALPLALARQVDEVWCM